MTLRAVGADEAAVAAGVTVEEMKAEITAVPMSTAPMVLCA